MAVEYNLNHPDDMEIEDEIEEEEE